MHVVVNGASGFLGPFLVRELSRGGHAGLAVSRREVEGLPSGWRFVARDGLLSDSTDLGGKPDVFVHLEVKQHVPYSSELDLATFDAVNVEGTQGWLDWCTRSGVSRFVYFSSIKAVRANPAGETLESAAGPHPSPYGASKWAAEERVRAWVAADSRRAALILRPSVVYGPGNVGNVGAMVAAIQRHRFVLVGQNTNVKSMVSVRNAAAAAHFLLCRMAPGECPVFNIVDAENYSVRQWDSMIRNLLGRTGNSPTLPLPIARMAANVGDAIQRITGKSVPLNSHRLEALIEQTCFSCAKLKEAGFVHPQTTQEGLADMVASRSG